MAVRALVVAALLLGPAIASGESRDNFEPLPFGPIRRIDKAGEAPLYGFVGKARPDGSGMVLARQVLPARNSDFSGDIRDMRVSDEPVALAQSRIVYLNKNGVTLTPGDNDSRMNRSTLVTQQTAIGAWNTSAQNWQAVVTCMKDIFKPFDVRIVDTDPGNVPHMEAVFGGTPQQVNMDANVLGVSPFTLDCSIIENSTVFTFTGAFQFSAREACEIMAQEVAHSYGLDHELLAADPMTYLEYTGNRSFKDQAASCGEDSARMCGINGSVCRMNQNSVALLTARLGVAPATAPEPEPSQLDQDVVGGCSASTGRSSALLGLALALTARRRRRRR